MNAVQDQLKVLPASAEQPESPEQTRGRLNRLIVAAGLTLIASIVLFFTPELGRPIAGSVAMLFACAGAIVTAFAKKYRHT
jgi:hypothetical protein